MASPHYSSSSSSTGLRGPTKPLHTCPGFPSHTVAAIYVADLLIVVLAFLGLMSGVEGLPNVSPPFLRRMAAVIGGTLGGLYVFVHLLTPMGALDGFWGAAAVFVLIGAAAGVPVAVFREFREVLHNTPQSLLIGLHTVRVMEYLFLPLYDVGLVPLLFSGIAGWGGAAVGLLAPVVAYLFGVKHLNAREYGIAWNAVGVVEILLVLLVEGATMPNFMRTQKLHRHPIGYLWSTVFILVRYTAPTLLALHGYSLWKLYKDEQPRATMLWQDDELEELSHIYGADSPGPQRHSEESSLLRHTEEREGASEDEKEGKRGDEGRVQESALAEAEAPQKNSKEHAVQVKAEDSANSTGEAAAT